MDDAMVTGRVSAAKKVAGAKVLAKSGLNTSQAINLLFDKLDKEQNADFLIYQEPEEREWESAAKFLDSLHMPIDSRFEHMSDGEIKLERAEAKGWL